MANKRLLQTALAGSTAGIERGAPYQVGLAALPAQTELPVAAGALPERLQDIARQYIGARQRSGEALLDAARWLSEARVEAKHGEWQVFLEATGTSESAAKRLLDIHATAIRDPQFAEAIRTNWIGATVASELARPSLPDEKRTEILSQADPPKLADLPKPKSAILADLEPTSPADDDERHIAEARRILAKIDQWADSERPRQIQEAYAHAQQMRDLTKRSQLFGAIDRAVDGDADESPDETPDETPPPPQRVAPPDAPLPTPEPPDDWHWEYLHNECQLVGPDGWKTAFYRYPDRALSEARRRILSQPKATSEESPTPDELASAQARWSALGYQLLPDLAGPNNRYRLVPPDGRVGIVNMQWYAVLDRLAIQEQKAALLADFAGVQARYAALGQRLAPVEGGWRLWAGDDPASGVLYREWSAVVSTLELREQGAAASVVGQRTDPHQADPAQPPDADPRAALEARGWAFVPATSPVGWFRLEHDDLGYIHNEPTIDMAIREATALQADFDRRERVRDHVGTAADMDPVAHWFGQTHMRLRAMGETAAWVTEHRAQLNLDQQLALVEDVQQLVAELTKLISALGETEGA